jgi:hypothetical protein
MEVWDETALVPPDWQSDSPSTRGRNVFTLALLMDDQSQIIAGEAAVSSVLEPRRRRFFSRRRKNEEPLTHCENCGVPLTGPFCAQCGQHAVDYHRSIWRVLVDAADSFLNWDTKFLSTIGVLLTRPWKLTNDFNAGRRARYVHPLRLYLLASIAFFLIVKLVHFDPGKHIQLGPQDRAQIDATLSKLAGPDSPLPPDQREKVEGARAKFNENNGTLSEEKRDELEAVLKSVVVSGIKDKLKRKEGEHLIKTIGMIPEPSATPEETKPSDETSGASPTPSPRTTPENQIIQFSDDGNKAKSPMENSMETLVKEKIGEHGEKAKLFLETLRGNIPTMMLCCIPLFALILKVLYIRKGRFYVEHLIYALHIHTFAYVGVVVITLIGMGLAHWSDTARAIVCTFLGITLFVQVFLSIRRVYRQGWFFTTFKFLVGGIAYFVILLTAIGATVFITLKE